MHTSNQIITQASSLASNAIKALPTGIYIVQCETTPSDFATKGAKAYGILVHYGDENNYHHFLFTDETNVYKRTFGGILHDTYWQSVRPVYKDFYITPSTAGRAQLNSSSGNIVNYENFLNCFVIDASQIFLEPYTYNNLIYVRISNEQGQIITSGTYKVRCFYMP